MSLPVQDRDSWGGLLSMFRVTHQTLKLRRNDGRTEIMNQHDLNRQLQSEIWLCQGRIVREADTVFVC